MLLKGQFQNAYVTPDLERATGLLRDRYGIGEFGQYDLELDVTTPAGSGKAALKVALAWVGDIQYELIEPVSGLVDMYRDALPENGLLRFHHICMRSQDWDATRRELDARKLPIVCEGATAGTKFLYADARDSLGHYLEYVWMAPEAWAAMSER